MSALFQRLYELFMRDPSRWQAVGMSGALDRLRLELPNGDVSRR